MHLNKAKMYALIIISLFVILIHSQVFSQDAMIFKKHMLDDDIDGANEVFACDLDGDGDTDILGTACIDDDVIWWENDGNESFTKHVIDGSFNGACDVIACDLDGDNDIDVLCTAYEADDVAWFENDGSESFTKHIIDGSFNGADDLFACDVDGDNDIDVLCTAYEANDVAWFENDGNESFTKHVIDDNYDEPKGVFASDVDADIDIDVLCASGYGGHTIAWWENDGNESFTKHVIDNYFIIAMDVLACDLDEDNDVDVLGVSLFDVIAWWENDGNEYFSKHVIDEDFPNGQCLYACDMDGDNDIDVLCGSSDEEIAWWENDGSEDFTKHLVGTPHGCFDVFPCDVDGDHDIDVIGSSYSDDYIAWWENNKVPTANFSYTPLIPLVNQSIYFTDSSIDTDNSITTWYWDFDDGNDSSDQNPAYSYSSKGLYQVTLTVTDDGDASDSYSKLIPVGLNLRYLQELSNGWNFISLPFNESIDKSDLLMKFDTDFYEINYLFGWNRLIQSYEFADMLDPGYGYWLYSSSDGELWIVDIHTNYDTYITTVEEGWNIMGVPYYNLVDKTDVLVDDESWDTAVSNGWVSDYVFDWDEIGQSYVFSDTFIPTEAYWLYAYQDCVLKRNS